MLRALRPDAEKVVALINGERVELQHCHAGVWEAKVTGTGVTDYRLEVTYLGTAYPADDPYRYLPTLGEVDLHLIGEGRHEELAGLFGAWAPGAVTNADLSFSSRLKAAGAVRRLEDLALVDLAVGVLVAAQTIPPVEARHRLDRAAARAGVSIVDVARLLVDVGTGH